MRIESDGDIFTTGRIGVGAKSTGAGIYLASATLSIGITSNLTKTTGTNYAFTAIAEGSGATENNGLYIAATGATTNKAIYIEASYPPVGANNYAIHSASQAQSSFAGANFLLPNLASSGATTAVCWTTSTGLLTKASTTCAVPSARRFKLDIEPYYRGLELISQIQPQTFKLKSDGNSYIGLIADDLPDSRMQRFDENGGIEGYDEISIIATMINAIKELNTKIEALEQKCGQ
jgi:hypothetical protein